MRLGYKYERVIVPEIVKLYSNIPKIQYYSFGEFFKESFLKDEKHCLKIFFDIKPVEYFQTYFEKKFTNSIRYSDCVYLKSNGEETHILYRKRIYPFGKLFAHIFVNKNEIVLYVNRFYNSIFKLRVENILPPGIHLTYLTYLKLVLNGFLPLHAAAFALDKNEGFLVMAPPNTGKSLTAMKALENGFYYLSEDISVLNVNDLTIHAVPYTSTFTHETSAKRYLGLLNYFDPSTNVETKVQPFANRGIPISKLKKIFILERSNKNGTENASSGLLDIFNLNKNEFNFRSDIIINALLYDMGLNMESIEQSIFSNLCNKVDVITIKAKSPFSYFNLINQEVSS